jgi:tRNA(fMet)-specific endonuclease VapC
VSRYLLDTDILIDFSKRREPAFSFVHRAAADGDELGVTAITLAEFYAGLTPQQLPAWDAFVEPLEYWPLTRAAARQAGRWRYEFARRGQPLPTTDTLQAAVAMEQRAVIVTNNVRDYPMDGAELLPMGQ